MGLMDKVRAQSTQLAQVAQDAAREGKVRLDQAQAKRRADALFRDLGAAVYAERTGRGTPDSKGRIDRLVNALARQEADQGLGDPDGKGSPGESPAGPGGADGSPAGGNQAWDGGDQAGGKARAEGGNGPGRQAGGNGPGPS